MSTTAPEQQRNPLEEGLMLRRKPDPCVLVIFGASGDLTHKKLMPALYALMLRRLLPPRFAIVGVARTEADDDAFRKDMKEAVQRYARDEKDERENDTRGEEDGGHHALRVTGSTPVKR